MYEMKFASTKLWMPYLIGGSIGLNLAIERQSGGVQSDGSRVAAYHFRCKMVSSLSVGCADMFRLLKRNKWWNIRMHIEIWNRASMSSLIYVAYRDWVYFIVIRENIWEPSRVLFGSFVYVRVSNDPIHNENTFLASKVFLPHLLVFYPPFYFWNEICIKKTANASFDWW